LGEVSASWRFARALGELWGSSGRGLGMLCASSRRDAGEFSWEKSVGRVLRELKVANFCRIWGGQSGVPFGFLGLRTFTVQKLGSFSGGGTFRSFGTFLTFGVEKMGLFSGGGAYRTFGTFLTFGVEKPG
jgi:hypothetical protein